MPKPEEPPAAEHVTTNCSSDEPSWCPELVQTGGHVSIGLLSGGTSLQQPACAIQHEAATSFCHLGHFIVLVAPMMMVTSMFRNQTSS
jgi:hypothetical protein